jgi:hypothetical protein
MPKFNLSRFVKTFPKKHHVEYITALLSVPVLLSVIALNLLNLQGNSKKTEKLTVPQSEKTIIIEPPLERQTSSPTFAPTDTPLCKKEVGPISIISPDEGEAISDNPVCITIRYDSENYCSVVWSYRINGGKWSDYSNTSPCLYGLPEGDIEFELRVQSTVSQDSQIIERNFTYVNSATSSAASN